MSATTSLEERVASLEKELSEIKRSTVTAGDRNWIDRVAGSFKGDPDFGEILRLGEAWRREQRPQS